MTRRFPSLNALRTFEAAARNTSFSIAADELNVTQAAVSRQIRLLEDDMGVKLFRRLTRAVELTQEGNLLYPPLRDAFDEIERAAARVWGNKGTGVLTISVLPTFAVKWLMPRLSRFSEAHPEIEVHIVNSIKEANFGKDDIDLAIRVGAPQALAADAKRPRIELPMATAWEALQTEPLMADELVAVSSPNYLKDSAPILRPEDLQGFTLLHMATRPNAWADYLLALGWKHDLDPSGPSYGHFFMSLQAAAEGKGIALVPKVLAEEDLKSGAIVRAVPNKVLSAGQYYLLGERRKWDQPKIRTFRRWLLSEIKGTAPSVENWGNP
ncbi:transcriptional regulator GcvA [uncultured Sulfitobacter sp.]|uniref:transcriptional regulator GcvA n=1 Tax=uncultured Sulfitobacter sp. TaxID=191468 RepID=UPI0025988260|nr:transcriptional regulator GcvA [uncultured Sulfitobacter sp.]